jgi:hypothetical protein
MERKVRHVDLVQRNLLQLSLVSFPFFWCGRGGQQFGSRMLCLSEPLSFLRTNVMRRKCKFLDSLFHSTEPIRLLRITLLATSRTLATTLALSWRAWPTILGRPSRRHDPPGSGAIVSKLILLKPLLVDVPIVPIKQQYEEQQCLGWLYLM